MASSAVSAGLLMLSLRERPLSSWTSRPLAALERLTLIAVASSIAASAYRLGAKRSYKAVVGTLFQAVAVLPGAGTLVEAGLSEEMEHIEHELLGDGDADAHVAIPEKGMTRQVVEDKLAEQHALSAGFYEGKKWGGIYHDDETELTELQNAGSARFNCANTLYPGVFPGVRKFEAEVVAMVLDMVHGPAVGAVGLLSSGGTESILLAVLAYREEGRAKGIDSPQIICSYTAHPALHKACHYFGVELLRLPADPVTQQLVPAHVDAAIGHRTVAVYASAPTFTHGVIDPIAELGALCQTHGIGLHVDNCLGGFLVSFLEKEGLLGRGQAPPKWDFRAAGVTTLSCDVHKYGNSAKGVSVVCFRDNELRRRTYVPSVVGCEGLYVTPTLQGSRAGGVIAQAWATMLYCGDDGYRKVARNYRLIEDKVTEAVGNIEGLRLLVTPDAACVPIVSTDEAALPIYAVASVLERKGWNPFTGQNPAVMTVCIGEQHLRVIDELIRDLKDAVAAVRAEPTMKLEGSTAVYGAAAAIPDALLDSVLRSYCDTRMRVKQRELN